MANRPMIGKVYGVRKNRSGHQLYFKATDQRYSRKNKRFSVSEEEMGEQVLVLDERTKRLQILCGNGKVGWIARWYLTNEIKEEYNQKFATIQKAIEQLMQLVPKIEQKEIVTELTQICQLLRQIQEEV